MSWSLAELRDRRASRPGAGERGRGRKREAPAAEARCGGFAVVGADPKADAESSRDSSSSPGGHWTMKDHGAER